MSSSTFYLTLTGFAAVTFLVYKLVLTPDDGNRPAAAAGDGADERRSPPSAAASSGVSSAPAAPSSSAGGTGAGDGGGAGPSALGGARRPPHARAGSGGAVPSPPCLSRGIVPHRMTTASAREAEQQRRLGEGGEDVAGTNRRERARVFARMFAPGGPASGAGDRRVAGRPPARGSNVVVTVNRDDVGCARLRKAMYLLGTYYNLFVVVACSEEDGDAGTPSPSGPSGGEAAMRREIGKIRDELLGGGDGDRYGLTPDVVPRHRVVASTRPKGRVAFARQLGGTELVLDHDGEVAAELGRFGFRVLRYPVAENGGGGDGSSPLGRFLIP